MLSNKSAKSTNDIANCPCTTLVFNIHLTFGKHNVISVLQLVSKKRHTAKGVSLIVIYIVPLQAS